MRENYNDTQAKILRVLSGNPPSLMAGSLKDEIDSVTRNAVDKQIAELRDSGEVEKVGEQESAVGGWPSNVYALTQQGKKAAAQLPEESDSGVSGEYVEQLRALREKVMELEETVAEHEERIDELEAQTHENEEKVEKTARGLKRVRDSTNGLES